MVSEEPRKELERAFKTETCYYYFHFYTVNKKPLIAFSHYSIVTGRDRDSSVAFIPLNAEL